MSVRIVTSLGDLRVNLFTDNCPVACYNFLSLCKVKYYNGCLFHTVRKNFTAHTGDRTATGMGGYSIFKILYDKESPPCDEIHADLDHSKMGTVSMDTAGNDLNASQFYITLGYGLDYLNGKHIVFGEVSEGLDTLSRINDAYTDGNNRPYKNIRIRHTYVLEYPFEESPRLAVMMPHDSPKGIPLEDVHSTDGRLEADQL